VKPSWAAVLRHPTKRQTLNGTNDTPFRPGDVAEISLNLSPIHSQLERHHAAVFSKVRKALLIDAANSVVPSAKFWEWNFASLQHQGGKYRSEMRARAAFKCQRYVSGWIKCQHR
jgi:hypothetical protein